jgi:hypothetical protein
MTETPLVPEFVWDAPETPAAETPAAETFTVDSETPVAVPPVTALADLSTLTPTERAALITQLRDQGKAAREAAKAARDTLKALRGESVSHDPERDAEIFGNIIGHLHGSETIVTDSAPQGFKRLVGTVTHEGVTYHVTASARVARRRGRPSTGA